MPNAVLSYSSEREIVFDLGLSRKGLEAKDKQRNMWKRLQAEEGMEQRLNARLSTPSGKSSKKKASMARPQ